MFYCGLQRLSSTTVGSKQYFCGGIFAFYPAPDIFFYRCGTDMDPFTLDQESNAARIFEAVPKYLDQTLSLINVREIDQAWATRLHRENRGNRIYLSEFVVIDDGSLYLIAESPHSNVDPRPVVMLYFWNNYLWPTYSLTCYWNIPTLRKPIFFRSFLMTGSKQLELLQEQSTRIILLRGHKCISAADMNLRQVNPEMWKLLDQRSPYQCVREEIGAKVLVTSYLDEATTPERELEYGWAQKLNSHVNEAIRFLSSEADVIKEREILKSSPFWEAFEPGRDPGAELYEAHQQLFWERHHSPTVAFQSSREVLASLCGS